ncbi:FAD-dependent oxidoreductase [Myroides sp. WP-1]|uniref:FAD-dependent oxidoreductase n=1 Tax=Myroides sp. WP-1 TaxID=2759944 RepID=UPI0015F79738|nr:FAD-dependent oxidoreductase [Myroides sp. WP-1]MBB1139510.1 NAD(P)/FAD-dependent oxidoreductase [Myroides sp. WP-1]
MLVYDVLIIGGGVSGVSCAQILGSAEKKAFMEGKKIGIIMHQKGSMLQDAVFNNAFGIQPGTLGSDLLTQAKENLQIYANITQIEGEKVNKITRNHDQLFAIETNKSNYLARVLVVAINSSATFAIEGLMEYVQPHKKSIPAKNRVQLKNIDHLVAEGIYVAGTLAGHRSQLAIAAGSGAAVATDILTLWNDGVETHSHDSIRK